MERQNAQPFLSSQVDGNHNPAIFNSCKRQAEPREGGTGFKGLRQALLTKDYAAYLTDRSMDCWPFVETLLRRPTQYWKDHDRISTCYRPQADMIKRLSLAATLLAVGIVIFVLGNPYYTVWPMNGNTVFYYFLSAVFLVAALLLRLSRCLQAYWQVTYTFFMASAALLFMSTGFLSARNYRLHPLKDLAVDKVSQFLYVVPLLIVLTLLAGDDLASIFIRKGNFKRGLIFGLSSFGVFALIAWIVQPDLVSILSSLPHAVPWLLLFVFANASMEELWFRAIFIKRFEPLIGGVGAVLVTSLVFALAHVNATYAFPGGPYVFALVVFILGAIGAYEMGRENGLLGAVLFHAGYDLVIISSILSSQ